MLKLLQGKASPQLALQYVYTVSNISSGVLMVFSGVDGFIVFKNLTTLFFIFLMAIFTYIGNKN